MRDFSLYSAFSFTLINLRQQKWRKCFQKRNQPWKFNKAYETWHFSEQNNESFEKDLTTAVLCTQLEPSAEEVGLILPVFLRKLLDKYALWQLRDAWPSHEAHTVCVWVSLGKIDFLLQMSCHIPHPWNLLGNSNKENTRNRNKHKTPNMPNFPYPP